MVYLTYRVHFCASHRYYLNDKTLEENQQLFGPTANWYGHGHNYYVEATVRGKIDNFGVVPFYREFCKRFGDFVDKELDHKFLNEDLPFFQKNLPTTENIAIYIWRELVKFVPEGALYSVRVWEEPDLFAEYYGE